MELLTASNLKSRHGFPTRHGGRSKPPFDSLNASYVVGDDRADVAANLSALAEAAGAVSGAIVTAGQVHGARVVAAEDVRPDTEADAVWTASPGVSVGIRTADCLPILIEDRASGRVAAVHAGWRGVESEIVTRAVEQLVPSGSCEHVYAAVGPFIQRCCFEVDGDLPARFERAFGEEVLAQAPAGEKTHLDLGRAVQLSLLRAGVGADHVVVLPHCTRCDARFFSHRRDRGVTGRQLSFITCAARL